MTSTSMHSYQKKTNEIAERGVELFRDVNSWPRYIGSAIDPIGMLMPLSLAFNAWMQHPHELSQRTLQLSTDLWRLQQHFIARGLGLPSEDPIEPHPDDDRFSDPIWVESAEWDWVKENYLAFTRNIQDMLYDTPGISSKERRRAAFWWRTWLNMVAPTNFLFSNPVALRRAAETNGHSLINGMQQFLSDMREGDIRMTDLSKFKVGRDVAITPGAVIFRNRLLELIHYTPTQSRVHTQPIVIVTPWINKFYVLDLNKKRSMIQFLLDQGFDVFITSWKNPSADMSDTSFDDYVTEGIDAAVQTANRFCQTDQAHVAGYCIGGTALTAYMAWATRKYGADKVPVADWTLFTTLTDFSAPGDIEVFIDESSVRHMCRKMQNEGYLDGKEMALSFRLLRSNSLIWHYVVHGWLYGETPPPFDVLFWNMDSTRMPATMHSWYLKELYLNNNLIKTNKLNIAGQPIDLAAITRPLYCVAAEDDHIAPWQQVFRTTRHILADKRFVLSSSGHILGILNPPVNPPKRNYRASQVQCTDTAAHWKEQTPNLAGSWWEDWMTWLKPRAGKLIDARPASTKAFPQIIAAPGQYVHE